MKEEKRAPAVQRGACQLIPQGINLALSIRELVRQGYLFAALVLLRPLVERTAIISYIHEKPESVMIWKRGWKYKECPSLASMLGEMKGPGEKADVKPPCDWLNHLVHGDPHSAYANLVDLGEDSLGYAVGKILDNPALCDDVSFQTLCYVIVLVGQAIGIFPEVDLRRPPDLGTVHCGRQTSTSSPTLSWVPHSLGRVEKHSKRHSEERSDVAILLAFNIRDCHAGARNDENRTFSTGPKRWATQPYETEEKVSNGKHSRRISVHSARRGQQACQKPG